MINSTSLNSALQIFGHMSAVFLAEYSSPTVRKSLRALQDHIQKNHLPDDIASDFLKPEDTEPSRKANTLLRNSPFHVDFKTVQRNVESMLEEEDNKTEENPYHCPEVINVLFRDYLGIFPLWSGVMLGDLAMYATDAPSKEKAESACTRQTNCHAENWFGIVKNNILQKERFLRPGVFIQKLHASLRARYMEHSLQYGLTLNQKPLRCRVDLLDHSEEQWAKRTVTSRQTKTKYFDPPKNLPTPKAVKWKKMKATRQKSKNTANKNTSEEEKHKDFQTKKTAKREDGSKRSKLSGKNTANTNTSDEEKHKDFQTKKTAK
ncbi:hypothetical protein PFLUV_G00278600, partial [Perca fluviatilis]